MHTRLGEFHDKVGCGEYLAILAIEIRRTLALVLCIQAIIDDFVDFGCIAQSHWYAFTVIATRFGLTWAVNLLAVETFQAGRTSAHEAVA